MLYFKAMKDPVDVLIIGGSIAGLSAAMTLGRSLRKVLVVDRGTPCNSQAPKSYNFVTQDGSPPHDILAKSKAQVLRYPSVAYHEDEVVDIESDQTSFTATTRQGKEICARRIVFATGLKDIMPNIEGFKECWGISILHCPYCHGYESRNEPTLIIANGEAAYHLGTLVHNWTQQITILTDGVSELRNEEAEKMQELGIEIIENEIQEIVHDSGNAREIVFKDHSRIAARYIYASIPFEQQSDLPEKLGCKINKGKHIDVDDEQRTSVERIYAVGDCTAQARAISLAAASGTKAGFTINVELILKD
jgi:thioredoxin reductase